MRILIRKPEDSVLQQVTEIHWGDGYLTVSPAFPDTLPAKLKYWRRSLDWDEEAMRRVATGQYEELYQIKQWIDSTTQQLNQQLITMPGFMHRVKAVLRAAGWQYKIFDERTPMPKPDLVRACRGLRDYQVPAAYTAIMSGGGIISAPTGLGKCTSYYTPIMFADGHIAVIDTVKPGDYLMGDDSTPRKVLERIDGEGPMYRITPVKGAAFDVADDHVLSLVHTETGKIVEVTVNDYLTRSNNFKHLHNLYRTAVTYPPRKDVTVEPYYLGLWLGDGDWNRMHITKPDAEIADYVLAYAKRLGLRGHAKAVKNRCMYTCIVGERGCNNNTLLTAMRAYGLTKAKDVRFVPDDYLYGSREVRLQVLAGLLDSDGSLTGKTDFDWVSTNTRLSADIASLARGLGFRAMEKVRQCRGFGKTVTAYRVQISGDTHLIPTRIARKQARVRKQIKSPLRTGFSVKHIPSGRYVGVRLDGNQRHLLWDTTVLHNTHIMGAIVDAYTHTDLQARGTPLTLICTPDKDITAKDYRDIQQMLPHREVGLVMTGHSKFSDDVQVITLDSLHRIDPNEVGIVIVDEVHSAASDKRTESILAMRKAVRWGVSATPTGRFDGRDLVTEGLFGPVVYTRTYGEGVKDGALVPITVYWVTCPEPPMGIEKYEKFTTRPSRYRHAVLRNKARNELLGGLIQGIPKTRQLMCIMQFMEQMDYLKPYCGDGVDIVHAKTDAADMARFKNLYAISPKERKEIYQRMEHKEITKILSTYVYKQGVNFPELEIVINAGGGGSEIVAKQIPGRESRKTKEKEQAFLIDFWHPWDRAKDKRGRLGPGPVHADDQSRERTYKQLGFNQIWVSDLNQLPFLRPQEPVRTTAPAV